MDINTVCVCGAGTMGSGIAQLSAQSGCYTILYDLNRDVLQKAKLSIEASLDMLVNKQKISKEAGEKTRQTILYTNDIHDCIADLFIEAIAENYEWKIGLFNQLAELNHSDCIFATNTSSLSITSLANSIQHPQRVLGLHFFNPAPLMKLVEVVTTSVTSPSVKEDVLLFATRLGKIAVECKDAPGFIVNHVARPYYLEALRLLENKMATIEDIDEVMEAAGFKMGPFKLMDLIGNDINYAVSNSVYEQMGKPLRLKPSPVQEAKVQQKHLGRKTGKGYYDYEQPSKS